jgi:hypothetical protein
MLASIDLLFTAFLGTNSDISLGLFDSSDLTRSSNFVQSKSFLTTSDFTVSLLSAATAFGPSSLFLWTNCDPNSLRFLFSIFDSSSDLIVSESSLTKTRFANSMSFGGSSIGRSSFVDVTREQTKSLLKEFIRSSSFSLTFTFCASHFFGHSRFGVSSPMRQSRDVLNSNQLFVLTSIASSFDIATDSQFESRQMNETETFHISSTFTRIVQDGLTKAQRAVIGSVSSGGWVGIGLASAFLISVIVIVLWFFVLRSHRRGAGMSSSSIAIVGEDHTIEADIEFGHDRELLSTFRGGSFEQSEDDDHWGPPFANIGEFEETATWNLARV